MKKDNTNFKFVIGRLSDNDPFTRLIKMDGNRTVEYIYKTETENVLQAQIECLRELSDYVNKIANEYEEAINI